MIAKGSNKITALFKGNVEISKSYYGDKIVFNKKTMKDGALVINGELTPLASAFGFDKPIGDENNLIFSNIVGIPEYTSIVSTRIYNGTDPDGNQALITCATIQYTADGYHFSIQSTNEFIDWIRSKSTDTYIDIDARYSLNPEFSGSRQCLMASYGSSAIDYSIRLLNSARQAGIFKIVRRDTDYSHRPSVMFDSTYGSGGGAREFQLYIYNMTIRS